ncbi:pyruvate dehydrogenase protein X component-like [Oppia nitens]|uniref:pyruvate dehydrogenase protein X component-like n=1 Tax=Oppia nitens TaxID=1686743 RepID=UPI0023DA22A0|nr:pyruvate dehydrogenase protein X component-like [Oppia nitens]
MCAIFRKHLFKALIINDLLKRSSKCLKLNDLPTNQLLCRYIQTSDLLFGTKGIPILMPSLSPTMTTGTIVKWVKKEGDPISPGDLICEVQTDKAIVGLELEEEGILAKIMLPNDTQDIKVGTLIGLMVEEGSDWKDVELPKDVQQVGQQQQQSQQQQTVSKIDETKHQISQRMGPSVRNLLNQYSIDSNLVKPSGPHNILLKEDILNYINDNKLKAIDFSKSTKESSTTDKSLPQKTVTKSADYIDIELTNMRKTIAKRLTQSKSTIPHSYMTYDFVMNDVLNLRKQLKASGTNVSVNDFLIKAAAIALKKVPQINCSWIEESSTIQISSTVDISVAVATPNGLITPIVKNANQLDLETINKTVKALAEKAREGKLQPNEFIGGSFSISNLGMFGVKEFTAVINPPQAAILAVGASRLVLDDRDQTLNVVRVQLSFDSRAIEEETAAKFLEVLKNVIEDPISLQNSDGSDNRRLNYLIS